jgi:hypothetical protein
MNGIGIQAICLQKSNYAKFYTVWRPMQCDNAPVDLSTRSGHNP